MRTAAAFAAVAASLLACSGDDDGPAAERPIVFGGDRPIQLQVPADFDQARRYPLIVVLHGYGAAGVLQQSLLRLGDLADREDALVLAPDGTRNRAGFNFWNADPVCCDMDGSGVDDVAYLGGLIDDVRAAWPVDPARIQLIGHSNGSFMAYRMACERADVITAIAGLAGAAASNPAGCTPARPVHVLHMHGTADETVGYESQGLRPGALASVTQWAGKDGCTGTLAPTARKDLDGTLAGDETQLQAFAGCPAGGQVDLWTIEGGSHLPDITPAFRDELLAWLAGHTR